MTTMYPVADMMIGVRNMIEAADLHRGDQVLLLADTRSGFWPECGGNSFLRYPCLKNFIHNCLITNDLEITKANHMPVSSCFWRTKFFEIFPAVDPSELDLTTDQQPKQQQLSGARIGQRALSFHAPSKLHVEPLNGIGATKRFPLSFRKTIKREQLFAGFFQAHG